MTALPDQATIDANWSRFRHAMLADQIPRATFGASRGGQRIAFFHDFLPQAGRGAELSSGHLFAIGADLGFDLDWIAAGDVARALGVRERPAFAIVNNIRGYSTAELRLIFTLLFEDGVPFVVWEHDVGFCVERGAVPCGGDVRCCEQSCQGRLLGEWPIVWLYRQLAERAQKTYFLSPMQRALHERALGTIPRGGFLPSAIDVDAFAPVPGVERDPKLAVCAAGRLTPDKGLFKVAEWAAAHPDVRVEVYADACNLTRSHDSDVEAHRENQRRLFAEVCAAHPNLEPHPLVPPESLPAIYSRATWALVLPQYREACGRTAIEAALCGCEVVSSETVGVTSFSWWRKGPDAIRAAIKAAPFAFWRDVEEMIS